MIGLRPSQPALTYLRGAGIYIVGSAGIYGRLLRCVQIVWLTFLSPFSSKIWIYLF